MTTTYTNQTKNTSSYSNTTKHSSSYTNVPRPFIESFLLLENGGYMLLETGDKIILEQSIPSYVPIYTFTTKH